MGFISRLIERRAAWRRRSIRIYSRLRDFGQFLGGQLLPFRNRARLLVRMWPVSVVWIVLTLCFLLPGLANSQTFEAMLEYARGGEETGILWFRLLLTALLSFGLGSIMNGCARKLLKGDSVNNAVSPRFFHLVLLTCRWLPTTAMAAAFYRMQSAVAGSFYPYGAMALTLVAFQIAFPFASRAMGRTTPAKQAIAIARDWRGTLIVTCIATAIFFFGAADKDTWIGLPLSSIGVSQGLGPINILILFLSTFVVVTTSIVRFGRVIHLPLTWMLIAFALLISYFDLNDNHLVRQVEEDTSKAPTVEDAFDEWMSTRPDKKLFSEYPVILVSAEGGGIRAAFFTAITLARIADRCPRMVGHIFAISGVSGGAYGAALFAAAIKAWPIDQADLRCDLKKPAPQIYENALAEVLEDDHLSPLLARMLFPDAVQQIVPYPIMTFDRQRGLEYSIERSFRRVFGEDLMSTSIYDLRPDKSSLAVPYLFLNATEVQSGRRFVITPLFLQSQPFGGAHDWHWLDWDHGPPLSAAAGLSARFPVFSPAGYFFNNGQKARYVDGGYVDNSGTVTLSEVFQALYLLREEKYLEDYKGEKTTKFAMTSLHIGNAPACDVVEDEVAKAQTNGKEARRCDPNDPAPNAAGFSELFSPLEAVMAVRSAQVEYNLYQFHNRIELGTDLNRYDSHARVQMYDRGIPAPLGWLLSGRVATELRSQLDARAGEPDCRKQIHSSNLCELVGAVAGVTWQD